MSPQTKQLQWNLLGIAPPDDFKGDGCTGVPDGHWGEACRYHDWYYQFIRDLIDQKVSKHVVKAHRLAADAFFKSNLKTLGGPAHIYYIGVRLCAWRVLKRYRRKKDASLEKGND